MLLKETEQFAEQLQASLLKKSEAGMQRVTDRVTQDLKRKLPKLTEQKLDSIEEKLQRQFIHHVLMMIDQSVAADDVATK